MITKIFCIAFMLLFSVNAFCVPDFSYFTYNGPGNQMDQSRAVFLDQFGNFYVTGNSYGGSSKQDWATIKYGANGTRMWVVRYNGPGNSYDSATALVVDPYGNVYVTGWSRSSTSFGSENLTTIMYNSAGSQMWVHRYNGPGNCYDYGMAIGLDMSGNVYVTGTTYSGSSQKDNYVTIKYNQNGVVQWTKFYNGTENRNDRATSIFVTPGGDVYVTGMSEKLQSASCTYDYDYATVKYNSAGAQQWVKRYNGPANSDDFAYSITGNGTYVCVTGASKGASSNMDYATLKYSAAGTQLWLSRYNGPGNNIDEARSITVDVRGDVYVTGASKGSGTDYDYATIKYSGGNGSQLWLKRYNGPSNTIDKGWDVKVTKKSCPGTQYRDGMGGDEPCWEVEVYVTGQSQRGSNYDVVTQKYSEDGAVKWTSRFNGPFNNEDAAVSLAARDGQRFIFTTGWTNTDYGTFRYYTEGSFIGDNDIVNFEKYLPELSQNYPNPFNPASTIRYSIPRDGYVKLFVSDVTGKVVSTLVDRYQAQGDYEVMFDGSGLASGVYFYRIETESYSDIKKMILIK